MLPYQLMFWWLQIVYLCNDYPQTSTYKTAERTEEIILILRINDKGVERMNMNQSCVIKIIPFILANIKIYIVLSNIVVKNGNQWKLTQRHENANHWKHNNINRKFNVTDHTVCSKRPIMHEQVKSNLYPENKWVHIVRMYRKWKREQTTSIWQLILLCSNVNHAWTSEKLLTGWE